MPKLTISVLGWFEVYLDGQALKAFQSEKVRALLAYLAVESSTPHYRGKLANLLWPNSSEARARHCLSQALYDLRGAIGDADASPSFLLIHPKTIQFNPASDHWLDALEFSRLVKSYAGQPNAGLFVPSHVGQLEKAVALYRGPFLEGLALDDSNEFEDWLQFRREECHRLVMRALRRLIRVYERQGEYFRARQLVWRQLELAPWQEDVHQQAIRLLMLSGRRSEALEQYEACRRILQERLGIEPGLDTKALYQRILSEEEA